MPIIRHKIELLIVMSGRCWKLWLWSGEWTKVLA